MSRAKDQIRSFGSTPPVSSLELQLEYLYLDEKKFKHEQYLYVKNLSLATHWTTANFKRSFGLRNFHSKNLQYFDEDYVPLFEAVVSKEVVEEAEGLILKKQLPFYERVVRNFFDKNKEREKEELLRPKFEETLANSLLYRLREYNNSIEFVNLLGIPPDYYIELAIYNFHVWLLKRIVSRLAEDPEHSAQFNKILKFISKKHLKEVKEIRYRFSLRYQSDKYLDVHQMCQSHDSLFDHFFESMASDPSVVFGAQRSRDIHMQGGASSEQDRVFSKIKSMVHQIIFLRKMHPKDTKLDYFSEYVWQLLGFLETVTHQEVLEGHVVFNVMRIGFDFGHWKSVDVSKVSLHEGEPEWVVDELTNKVCLSFLYLENLLIYISIVAQYEICNEQKIKKVLEFKTKSV